MKRGQIVHKKMKASFKGYGIGLPEVKTTEKHENVDKLRKSFAGLSINKKSVPKSKYICLH